MKPERIQIFAPTERVQRKAARAEIELPAESSKQATAVSSALRNLGERYNVKDFIVTVDRHHTVVATFEIESVESLTEHEQDLCDRIEMLFEILTQPVPES